MKEQKMKCDCCEKEVQATYSTEHGFRLCLRCYQLAHPPEYRPLTPEEADAEWCAQGGEDGEI